MPRALRNPAFVLTDPKASWVVKKNCQNQTISSKHFNFDKQANANGKKKKKSKKNPKPNPTLLEFFSTMLVNTEVQWLQLSKQESVPCCLTVQIWQRQNKDEIKGVLDHINLESSESLNNTM